MITPTFFSRLALAALLALLLIAGYQSAKAGEPELERVALEINVAGEHYHLEVELARTTAERQRGLMDRDTLAADAGMLFLYDQPQSPQGGFWMYRTRIPLDIAFLDHEGRIAALYTMQPCASSNPYACPATVAGVTYHAALEVNAGYFEARGIEVGACVSWPGREKDCNATQSRAAER